MSFVSELSQILSLHFLPNLKWPCYLQVFVVIVVDDFDVDDNDDHDVVLVSSLLLLFHHLC